MTNDKPETKLLNFSEQLLVVKVHYLGKYMRRLTFSTNLKY